MHSMIYVIGDDPQERAAGLTLDPGGEVDWAGIGGRYSGQLCPLPGATTGRRYGDTLPAAEAWMAAVTDGTMRRGVAGVQYGPGVDQIEQRELDIPATPIPVHILDAGGTLHGPGLATDEWAAMTTAQQLAAMADFISPDSQRAFLAERRPALKSASEKLEEWARRGAAVLAAAAPDALVTVVDIHY